jgi:hypothetical protein
LVDPIEDQPQSLFDIPSMVPENLKELGSSGGPEGARSPFPRASPESPGPSRRRPLVESALGSRWSPWPSRCQEHAAALLFEGCEVRRPAQDVEIELVASQPVGFMDPLSANDLESEESVAATGIDQIDGSTQSPLELYFEIH